MKLVPGRSGRGASPPFDLRANRGARVDRSYGLIGRAVGGRAVASEVRAWVARVDGNVAGFVELEAEPNSSAASDEGVSGSDRGYEREKTDVASLPPVLHVRARTSSGADG